MSNDLHIIMGAHAIAKELGMTRRQVYGLIYGNVLPTVKLGGTVAIRRSALATWVSALDAA